MEGTAAVAAAAAAAEIILLRKTFHQKLYGGMMVRIISESIHNVKVYIKITK